MEKQKTKRSNMPLSFGDELGRLTSVMPGVLPEKIRHMISDHRG
jgi:hypothetical protein